MATRMSKPHSSAVGSYFLNSYEGAFAMRGNKVPRYGQSATPSGAALYPKRLRIGDELLRWGVPLCAAALLHPFEPIEGPLS